jgi:hypothetical protein
MEELIMPIFKKPLRLRIENWMAEHPNDKPYPRNPDCQLAWRRARGLAPLSAKEQAKLREYEAIMAAKRGIELG